MRQGIRFNKAAMGAVLMMGTVALMGGCATKQYVRTSVDDSSHTLSARMDKDETTTQANAGQIDELNGVSRDHSQKIASLNDGLQQTNGKAEQALSAGQNAQSSADKASNQVSSLDSEFQNRNHYVVLKEEQVRFKFSSAKLEPSFKEALNNVASQLKQNPDAILVMEGHTDAVGPDDYNIRLGQERVEAVRRYLVVDQEVPINRISDMSFGKARPVNSEKGKAARAENRSVVVRVMGPQLTASTDSAASQAGPATQSEPQSTVQ